MYFSLNFLKTNIPGDNREWELPETIPNSEVKTFFADDSMDLSM